MAITTLDGFATGARAPVTLLKIGGTMAVPTAALRAYTFWYANGSPGASTATAVGVNGEAVTPALGSVGGRIPRVNPTGGNLAYLSRLAAQSSGSGVLVLIDRLWQNSGLVVTSTSAQAITPATLPSRSRDGTANGEGVMAAVEWSTVGGAGTPTVTLTYTDQDGNTGASATLTGLTTPFAGAFEIFTLSAGDTGIRAPTSFIQSATRTSGTMHLVLFRVIAQVEITAANTGNAIDALTGGAPQIYDDSVLQLLWFPSASTAVTLAGQYVESQG